MEFDNYSSHLLVFEKIFETFEINNALEFGLGIYSTTFFTKHCKSVVSVEEESQEWYEKMKVQINSANWHPLFQPDPQIIFNHFDAADEKFDLVFSDGARQTRCLVANLAMQRNVPVVVLHDAEKIWYYRWNLLEVPDNYSRFDFRHQKGVQKTTSILTNIHANLLEEWNVPEHDRIVHAYSSPGQPVFFVDYRNLLTSIEDKLPEKPQSRRRFRMIESPMQAERAKPAGRKVRKK